MKKIVFILVIAIIIIGIVIGKNVLDSKKVQNEVTQESVSHDPKDVIKYEIDMINKITAGSYNQEEIDQVLNRTETTGDYAVVEKAIKKYMKDYIDMSSGITETMNQINLNAILSEENVNNDKPDFVNTKTKLSDAKLKLEEYKTNSTNFLTEEKIKSYLSDSETISEEARNFYNTELAKMTEEDKEVISQLDSTFTLANSIIAKEEAIIDFLITNKNAWELKNGAISFDTADKAEGYNALINELVGLFD